MNTAMNTNFLHTIPLLPRFLLHSTRLLLWTCCLPLAAAADDGQIADSKIVTAQIDQHIQSAWQQRGLQPATTCSDTEFLRRLSLDLTGRIPSPAELTEFLSQPEAQRRSAAVERLLASTESARHLAETFDTLLMGRGRPRDYQRRKQQDWLTWLERQFHQNRPWNQVVHDLLLARPNQKTDRGAVWFLYERENNHQKIAEAIAPAVFGIRIECAQCHDHMVATEIEQRHYWGLVAFFNRSTNADTPAGPQLAESAIGGFSDFAGLEGDSHPNLLTFFASDTVAETRPAAGEKQQDSDDLYTPSPAADAPRIPKFSRREAFVREIVDQHPLVARAFVNRAWAMLLGRGLVHPFDQMDSAHPPSHPELLDWLANDFRTSNHNVRRLLRALLLSQPYALSSVRPAAADNPADFTYFLEKPLTAEQLLRSWNVALHAHPETDQQPLNEVRSVFPEVLPETITTGIDKALFLSNNPVLPQLIAASTADGGLLHSLTTATSPEAAVTTAFQRIYARSPSAEEQQAITLYLQQHSNANDTSNAWQQVLWAMLTSAEFRFNH